LLRKLFPNIVTPDFVLRKPKESYEQLFAKRMSHLNKILYSKSNWIIIGSSFGGLMGTLFTLKNPDRVKKLILLAPYLNAQFINFNKFEPIKTPVIVYHGEDDNVIPYVIAKEIANKIFINLRYNIVEDDHFLHPTVISLDWKGLIFPK
jgi:pimeloyl-ACP methyl ester carboxylesterase